MVNDQSPRAASSVKAKVFRGIIQAFATIGGMTLTGWLQANPAWAAAVPAVLGPLGGWLRNKYPDRTYLIPF